MGGRQVPGIDLARRSAVSIRARRFMGGRRHVQTAGTDDYTWFQSAPAVLWAGDLRIAQPRDFVDLVSIRARRFMGGRLGVVIVVGAGAVSIRARRFMGGRPCRRPQLADQRLVSIRARRFMGGRLKYLV